MSVRISGSKGVWWSVLLASSAGLAHAGAGGGSGRARTPYLAEPTLKEIKAARADAKPEVRYLNDAAPDKGFIGKGLCFAKNKQCVDHASFTLRGKNGNGGAIDIALADVSSFKILAVTGAGATRVAKVEAVIFPTLTPKQLFSQKPTFSALTSKTVVMQVPLARDDGASLSFVSRNGDDTTVASVGDVTAGDSVTVKPAYELYWWAIPSVIADPKFPYRAIMKH